jgi:Winged helix-turn-helix domain (DUF2582)
VKPIAAYPTSTLTAGIGETAGQVWTVLDRDGPLSMTRLTKTIGKPRDMTMQAIGWLAREGKIDITEERRSRIVTLR